MSGFGIAPEYVCVLDLDHTLVHAQYISTHTALQVAQQAGHNVIRLVCPQTRREKAFVIHLRPGVYEFLQKLVDLEFRICIFTAGIAEYAAAVVSILNRGRIYIDPSRHVFASKHMVPDGDLGATSGVLYKTLQQVQARTGVGAENILIIDDRRDVWRGSERAPWNVIPIPCFISSNTPVELKHQYLKVIGEVCDFILSLDGAFKPRDWVATVLSSGFLSDDCVLLFDLEDPATRAIITDDWLAPIDSKRTKFDSPTSSAWLYNRVATLEDGPTHVVSCNKDSPLIQATRNITGDNAPECVNPHWFFLSALQTHVQNEDEYRLV